MSSTVDVKGSRFERTFTTDFSVLNVTTSQDSGGAYVKTESELLTSKGFFEPLSGAERIENAQKGLKATFRLFCLPDCEVNVSQRIRIGLIDYEVEFVADYAYGSAPHLELYLKTPEE